MTAAIYFQAAVLAISLAALFVTYRLMGLVRGICERIEAALTREEAIEAARITKPDPAGGGAT